MVYAGFVLFGVLAGLPLSTCRPATDGHPNGGQHNANVAAPVGRVVFPDALRVEDESVNEFIERAMKTCAGGVYDDFRLLWSIQREPLSREEYEKGWQAIREIRVRALEQVKLAPDSDDPGGVEQLVYALLARVDLDAARLPNEEQPHREVALMLLREHDQWRLAHGPKALRAWIAKKTEIDQAAPGDAEKSPSRQPDDD